MNGFSSPCFKNVESVVSSIHVDFDTQTVAAKLATYTGLRRIPGSAEFLSAL